jgi:2-keto-4-pentenoate hydratase/2-oxohepta-3-ene-1,7-dioic acid hydratase in catechol pathway
MTDNNRRASDLAECKHRLTNLATNEGYAIGIEMEEGVVDLRRLAFELQLPGPLDVDDLLQNQKGNELKAIANAMTARPDLVRACRIAHPVHAPLVTRPEKIICIGFNYRRHAEETGTPIPKVPPVFAKYNNALNRHGGTIELPTRVARQFDFETELVIVFGETFRDVTEADALDQVAGYSTGNDFSARDLQLATSQFTAGKTSDGFAPIEPWLVPRGQISDPNDLTLRTWVNGDLRQNWSTNDMIFDCRKLISFVSSFMTIRAGDILYTGTPQGVILGEKKPIDQRDWLKAGDVITSEVGNLGQLAVTLR